MWKFGNRAIKESIGLDIASSSIKLAYLTDTSGQIKMHQGIRINIEPHSAETQTQATIKAMQKAFEQLETSYCRVSTALSEKHCFNQLLTLDQSQNELKASVLLVAAPALAIPLDTLYFDFKRIEEKDGMQQVLVVFCRQKVISEKKSLIESSPFQLNAIEPASHALERACRYYYALDQFPSCWACVLVTHQQMIILLWAEQKMLGTLSDPIEFSASPSMLLNQVYTQLIQLTGMYASCDLKAVWLLGRNPSNAWIEAQCRRQLGLTQHPILHLKNDTPINIDELNSFAIAIGLALGDLAT